MLRSLEQDSNPGLRANSTFRRLWLGQALSELGSQCTALGYPLLVLFSTGSPVKAGLVAFVSTATMLCVRIPAGALVDRWNCRTVMILADTGRAVALTSLAIAVLTGQLSFAHILVVAFAEAFLAVFFGPAEIRMVNHVVEVEDLSAAIAVNQARSYVVSVVAQPLGGLLFGIGRFLPFLVDAVSYLVSLVLVASVRGPVPRPSAQARRGLAAEIREGLGWLWRRRFLRGAICWLALVSAVFGALGLVSLVIGYQLGAAPIEIGIMYGMCGAGAVAGAVATPWLHRRVAPNHLLAAFGWTAAAVTPLLAVVPSIYLVGAVGAVAFVLLPPANALVVGHLIRQAPSSMHGRVSSAARQITGLVAPLGPLGAGATMHLIGARGTALACAGLLFVLATAMATSGRLRTEDASDPV